MGHGTSSRRAENVVAVVLFDEDRAAKPQTHRPGNTDGAKRLVRKVQSNTLPVSKLNLLPYSGFFNIKIRILASTIYCV